MKITFLPLCLLAFLFTFPSQAFVAQASAATITVNTTTDVNAANGLCTLREAIDNANTDSGLGSPDCASGSGADTITFAASLANQTITLTLGELNIISNMTIEAPAGSNLTVSGGGMVRVFNITPASSVVVLTGFRITGGNVNGDGGGIQNIGNLTLNNMVIEANTARFSGGGISTSRGTLNITGGSVTGNTATNSFGGGLYHQ